MTRGAAHRSSHGGFTLVELLVVVAIIAVAMAMMEVNRGSWSREAVVKTAADGFAALCSVARARALADNTSYAIAINIQNRPGSSGRVLNNGSGGHWYRMLGPVRFSQSHGAAGRGLLIAYPTSTDIVLMGTSGWDGIRTFPELAEALKDTWVGPE